MPRSFWLIAIVVVVLANPFYGQALSSDCTSVLCLVNRERGHVGEPALRVNAHLMLSAERHSAAMVRFRFFDDSHPARRIRAAGFHTGGAYVVGENIAFGYPSSAATVYAWMHSTEHRTNILDRRFVETGVGVKNRIYTQDFATEER